MNCVVILLDNVVYCRVEDAVLYDIVDVVYICDILCIDVVMCIVYYGICRMSCIKLCYGVWYV